MAQMSQISYIIAGAFFLAAVLMSYTGSKL